MKRSLSVILVFVLFAALFCSCSSKSGPVTPLDSNGEYYIAGEPSENEKTEINRILESFIKSFDENRPEDAYPLFTEGFSGTTEDLKSFFSEIRKICKTPFVAFDSYYLCGLEISESPIMVKHKEEDKNYIELTPVSEDLYCGMYVSEGEKTSYILSILLTKENDSWKIAWVNPGILKYNGEDAQAVFEKTKSLYNEGNLIGAYAYSCMLANIYRPCDLRYENELEMEDICNKLYSEVTEKFPSPFPIENTTNSEIHAIRITNDETDGVMPLFLVKTDTLVTDRDALVSEGKKIADALERLSPGLSKSFSHATFSVTNEHIDENNPTPKVSESFILPLE